MLLGVLGGAALDRFNRRNISILSDLISAASVALIPPSWTCFWGLNFWWFVVLGLMGAVGDIPGMTARDALLPTVTKRDGVDLQRFMGMSQSLDSLTTIVGPAIAALLIGTVGGTSALWFTAALSAAAAIVTMTLPRVVGVPETAAGEPIDAASPSPSRGIAAAAFGAMREGLRVLLRSDRVLACSTLFSFGIVMVMGSFQGLVLPVHFTLTGQPELLGYLLSALSGGMLISSLAYAALAPRLSRRAWYVTSLVGMAVGVALLSTLPPFPLMLPARSCWALRRAGLGAIGILHVRPHPPTLRAAAHSAPRTPSC